MMKHYQCLFIPSELIFQFISAKITRFVIESKDRREMDQFHRYQSLHKSRSDAGFLGIVGRGDGQGPTGNSCVEYHGCG